MGRPVSVRGRNEMMTATALWATLWNHADADTRTVLLSLAVEAFGAETVLGFIVQASTPNEYAGGAW